MAGTLDWMYDLVGVLSWKGGRCMGLYMPSACQGEGMLNQTMCSCAIQTAKLGIQAVIAGVQGVIGVLLGCCTQACSQDAVVQSKEDLRDASRIE
jgi:hypothetical protein